MSTPAKRPRERTGEALAVLAVDSAPAITNDLRSFLHPLSIDDFTTNHYRQRALAIKVHPKHRDSRLARLRELLHNFNPLEMLRSSSSEAINVWMRAGGELKSIKVAGAEDAKACYDAGHSLYFRANEDLEAEMLGAYCEQLGHGGFAAEFRDHHRRGEIETFATHIGHTTEWHWDFQENFTVQLRGAKRWTFKRGPVAHPHRAAATHFADARVLHTQNALHLYGTDAPSAPVMCQAPTADDGDAATESVVLQAGDVLYHPAGVWHKVETIADGPAATHSLSINMSLFPMTWGELLHETVQQLLVRQGQWRERIAFRSPQDARAQLDQRLGLLRAALGHVSAQAVLPDAVVRPAPHSIFTVRRAGCTPKVAVDAIGLPALVIRNPLGVMALTPDHLAVPVQTRVPVAESGDDDDEAPEEETVELPDDCVRFDYHANFAADEAHTAGSPAVHAVFLVQKDLAVDFARLAQVHPTAAVKLKAALGPRLPQDLAPLLIHLGCLVVPPSSK